MGEEKAAFLLVSFPRQQALLLGEGPAVTAGGHWHRSTSSTATLFLKIWRNVSSVLNGSSRGFWHVVVRELLSRVCSCSAEELN